MLGPGTPEPVREAAAGEEVAEGTEAGDAVCPGGERGAVRAASTALEGPADVTSLPRLNVGMVEGPLRSCCSTSRVVSTGGVHRSRASNRDVATLRSTYTCGGHVKGGQCTVP